MEQFPGSFRSLFPIAEKYAYLNHASAGVLARPALDAMYMVLEKSMTEGPRVFQEMESLQHTARSRAARLVNAQPHQIAFLRNTSEAIAVIANGIDWRAGDNVVSAAGEFPANVYPWTRIAECYEVQIRNARCGHNDLIDLEEMLSLANERTRVLAISWVQFATGQRLNIRRIGNFCRERGILFVVDTVQGLGALQLDVEKDCVDAFAAGAQKFLLGPKGVSLLYLSDDALNRIRPTVIGWTAVKNYSDYLMHDLDFREGAVRFEGGTPNVAGICGLSEAIELFLRAGPSQIEKHVLALNRYLTQELQQRGYRIVSSLLPEGASGILACQHDRYSAQEICDRLDRQNVITSARNGALRVSPHFYNTQSDVDALLAALPV
jgi:cysteine desulfurase / selenocysteine lyase